MSNIRGKLHDDKGGLREGEPLVIGGSRPMATPKETAPKGFDEKDIESASRRHCWPVVQISTVYENGFFDGARWQWQQDQAEILRLRKALARVISEIEHSTDKAFIAHCKSKVDKILKGEEPTP